MIHMMKVRERMLEWENGGKLRLLSTGYSLRAPELLFRKIEDAEVAAQIAKLNKGLADSAAQSALSAPQKEENSTEVSKIKPEIVFDDFAKIDLKVGTILSAEKVEKADKLLKLEINLGFEKRTILSGIANIFLPKKL